MFSLSLPQQLALLGACLGSDRVDLFRVEIEVDVAAITLAHRLGAVCSRSGIRHGLPAERTVENESQILGLEVITVASCQVESEETEAEERFTGDPGHLAIELSLSHARLLPAQPRASRPPCHTHREPGARVKTGLGNEVEEGDQGDRDTMLKTERSAGSDEPVLCEPGLFGFQGFATQVERPKNRAGNGREIGNPAALDVGLDVAGSGDAGAYRAL